MISKEAQMLFDAIRSANSQDDAPFSLDEERKSSNAAGEITHPAPGVVTTTVELEGIRTLCLTPPDHLPNRRLLFMHGGAFALMSPESHERFAGHVAKACRAQTFLPDYSLAPEYPFPQSINETITLLSGLVAEAKATESNVILLGESSGGALALGAAQSMRDQGQPLPSCIVLICPWLDLTLSGQSMEGNRENAILLQQNKLKIFADYYLQDPSLSPTDSLVSPLFGSLANLPPIYCQAAELDLLLDDATRLSGRDADTLTVEVFPEMCHSFQFFAGNFPEADAAIKMIGDFVDAQLG